MQLIYSDYFSTLQLPGYSLAILRPMPISPVEKIISGGQTGADRAALDWAIEHGISHGGWCPKGRRAEDGKIPETYCLEETPRYAYRQRTTWNIRDADATLILTMTGDLTGGTRFTCEHVKLVGKPHLHVIPGSDWQARVREFCDKYHIRVLNVAGPRSSSAPGIERFVYEVLNQIKAMGLFGNPISSHGHN